MHCTFHSLPLCPPFVSSFFLEGVIAYPLGPLQLLGARRLSPSTFSWTACPISYCSVYLLVVAFLRGDELNNDATCLSFFPFFPCISTADDCGLLALHVLSGNGCYPFSPSVHRCNTAHAHQMNYYYAQQHRQPNLHATCDARSFPKCDSFELGLYFTVIFRLLPAMTRVSFFVGCFRAEMRSTSTSFPPALFPFSEPQTTYSLTRTRTQAPIRVLKEMLRPAFAVAAIVGAASVLLVTADDEDFGPRPIAETEWHEEGGSLVGVGNSSSGNNTNGSTTTTTTTTLPEMPHVHLSYFVSRLNQTDAEGELLLLLSNRSTTRLMRLRARIAPPVLSAFGEKTKRVFPTGIYLN